MKNAIVIKKILHPFIIDGQYFYGSKRLGVDNEKSDYNIFIHISDISTIGLNIFELKKSNSLIEAKNYLSSTPKYGTVQLIKELTTTIPNCYANILVFTDKRDINIMNQALNTLYKGRQFLFDKNIRISLFNYALQYYGFSFSINGNYSLYTEQLFNFILQLPEYKDDGFFNYYTFTGKCNYTDKYTRLIKTKEQLPWYKNIYIKLQNLFIRK